MSLSVLHVLPLSLRMLVGRLLLLLRIVGVGVGVGTVVVIEVVTIVPIL